MRRIVHLGYMHKYDDGRILRKECVSLKNAFGSEITYITSDRNGITDKTEINGITICIIPAIAKPGVRLIRFMSDVLVQIDRIKPQICHIHEFVLYPLVPKLKKRGIKVILDMHENDVEDESERFTAKYGRIAGRFFREALLAFEKTTVRKADAVISVTPQIIDRVSKYGKTTEMITNYPNKTITENIDFSSFQKLLDTLCFAGGISDLWGISTILKVMDFFPDMHFILAGRVNDSYLERLKSYPAWARTDFLGSVSFARVTEDIYSKSGIGMALLSSYDGWIGRKGTLGNTKLFEFMQFGLPVICTDYSLWTDIVTKEKCGIAVDPFDENQIRDAILWLRNHPQVAYQMGQNGKRLVNEKFNWENESEKLIRLYEKVEA